MSNAINAITSYKSFLMYKYGGNWLKLVDVKDIPDLGSAPEMLDATTQSDGQRVFKPGIQENEALTFTANYTLAEFNMLKALEGWTAGPAQRKGRSGRRERWLRCIPFSLRILWWKPLLPGILSMADG